MAGRWLELLRQDHDTTEKALAAVESALATPNGPPPSVMGWMVEYVSVYVDRCHNQKEEQHLFPLIERRGIPREGGPLGVMLMEHERARNLAAELAPLGKAYAGGDKTLRPRLRDLFAEYATLMKQHFWKENDILYPMALRVLSAADGEAVVEGITAVEDALGRGTREKYYSLASQIVAGCALEDLSTGLDRDVLAAMLNTLPVELSFIDADDTVRYFSHEDKDKIFARARSAIGMKVQSCHPPKSIHLVNRILADFKAGKREVAEFWIDLGPKKVHIRYFPVRSPVGKYLGCMEVVQDVTRIQALEGQRRLLDEG